MERADGAAWETAEWRPHAAIPPGTRLEATRTWIVWDFDCSLASEHLWSLLRSNEGQHQLHTSPDAFYELVFGGADRIRRLRACLASLRGAGATLMILSNGFEDEIEAALRHLGLRECFAAVLGAESQTRLGTEQFGKPALLAKLALEQQAGGEPSLAHVVFVAARAAGKR